MEEAMDEQAWFQRSEEILRDIQEWRRAHRHPKATVVEIEDEVHKRMMQLEAQVLQDAAQESRSREWEATSAEEHPRCAKCGVPVKARGKHQRTLQGNGGQSVTLHRTYGRCPRCGEGFFPSG